jgi:hypothetical protein
MKLYVALTMNFYRVLKRERRFYVPLFLKKNKVLLKPSAIDKVFWFTHQDPQRYPHLWIIFERILRPSPTFDDFRRQSM